MENSSATRSATEQAGTPYNFHYSGEKGFHLQESGQWAQSPDCASHQCGDLERAQASHEYPTRDLWTRQGV